VNSGTACFLQSIASIPEPHEFQAILNIEGAQSNKTLNNKQSITEPEFRVTFKEGCSPELSRAVVSPMSNRIVGDELSACALKAQEQGHEMALGRSAFVSLGAGISRLSLGRKDGTFYGKLGQDDHDHNHENDTDGDENFVRFAGESSVLELVDSTGSGASTGYGSCIDTGIDRTFDHDHLHGKIRLLGTEHLL
jgi:hypothetical protein